MDEVNSSIDSAIIKLAEQAKASNNDHVKAKGFAEAVESLSNARASLATCKSAESGKKSN